MPEAVVVFGVGVGVKVGVGLAPNKEKPVEVDLLVEPIPEIFFRISIFPLTIAKKTITTTRPKTKEMTLLKLSI